MKNPLRGDTVIGLALALGSLLVYLATLSPSVQTEDAGELAAAFSTLGIAHPSGYPLLTLLGRAFVAIPLGEARAIWKLNLLMALLCAAAVFLCYRGFLFLLSRRAVVVGFPGEASDTPTLTNRVAAGAAALSFAFSRVFWTEALSVEVHALHLVMLTAVTALFLKSLTRIATNPQARADRWWLLFIYVLGLSFTNHLTTVLLAPAFIFLYFATAGRGAAAWKRIAAAIPPFLLGLSVYLYLPIRASAGPAINWGNPDSLTRFLDHVSTQQYRFRMFSSMDVAIEKTARFFLDLPSDFGWTPLVLATLGLWVLRRHLRGLIFTVLVFVACLVYAVNYDFNDPNFRLNAHFMVALWAAIGLGALLRFTTIPRLTWPLFTVAVLTPAFPLIQNYPVLNESGNYAVEDYTTNMLSSVEPGGVILSEEETHFLFPALYFQEAEGLRSDVVVMNLPLMLLPWYQQQLERGHPDLFAGVTVEREGYLAQRAAFEARHLRGANKPFDSAVYNASFQAFIEAFLRRNAPLRPVYVTRNISAPYGLEKLPSGLAYRLVPDTLPRNLPLRSFRIRLFTKTTPLIEDMRAVYAEGYANQGLYRITELGDTAVGIQYLRESLAIWPESPVVQEWLQRLEAPTLPQSSTRNVP